MIDPVLAQGLAETHRHPRVPKGFFSKIRAATGWAWVAGRPVRHLQVCIDGVGPRPGWG